MGALVVRGQGKVLTATQMDGECHLMTLCADSSFSFQEAGAHSTQGPLWPARAPP